MTVVGRPGNMADESKVGLKTHVLAGHPVRDIIDLAARIGLSVWPHLAQLVLFGDSFVRTFGRFDPVLKFTIRLRKQAHNFIEFRGGKSSGPAVQQLDFLTNPISMPRHANAPTETVSNAVLVPAAHLDGTIFTSSGTIVRPSGLYTRLRGGKSRFEIAPLLAQDRSRVRIHP